MRYAKQNDLEIIINMESSGAPVKYRIINQNDWIPTPFQSYEFTDEDHALALIDAWLDTQGGQP